MSGIAWGELFGLSVPWFELVVRGSVLYVFLLMLFRLVLRREIGAVGTPDMLLVVLLADASQNAMAGAYRSITDGLILVSTLIGWNTMLDMLAFYVPPVRRLLEPPPLALVRNGKMLRKNMRREFITEDELWAKLRLAGITDLTRLKLAALESDGEISVVQHEATPDPPSAAR